MKYYGYAYGADPADVKLQETALAKVGCECIVIDVDETRPQRAHLFKSLQHGDTLVVWRLDKFTSSVQDLVIWLEWFLGHGISFHAIQEHLDLETVEDPDLFQQLVAVMADIERNYSA